MGAEAPLRRAFRSLAPGATEELGEMLGRALAAGAVVALEGELGTGKTCLVRGLARGLGIREAVTSPSFVLKHEHEGRLTLHHFDAWMSGREQAFLAAGGAEALRGEGVCVVEWGSHVEDWLPRPLLWVRLEHRGPEERRLVVEIEGDPAERPDLVAALEGLRTGPGLEEEP